MREVTHRRARVARPTDVGKAAKPMSIRTRQRRRAAVAATRRPRGRIRFGGASRRSSRPALVLTRVLELCLLVGIVVALAASVVRAH